MKQEEKKGSDDMQAVLGYDISEKIKFLKERSNEVKNDILLRHIPSEHDIKICSEHTRLLHTHQQNTIDENG